MAATWRKCARLLLSVAREHPQALTDPEPTVFFIGFGESSLDFELAVWSDEMSYRPRRFRSDLYFAIEQKFREAGIEIPFPQRDVHLRSHAVGAGTHLSDWRGRSQGPQVGVNGGGTANACFQEIRPMEKLSTFGECGRRQSEVMVSYAADERSKTVQTSPRCLPG